MRPSSSPGSLLSRYEEREESVADAAQEAVGREAGRSMSAIFFASSDSPSQKSDRRRASRLLPDSAAARIVCSS